MNLVGSYWDGSQVSDTLDVAGLTNGQMMSEKRRFPIVLAGETRTYNVTPEGGQGADLRATETDTSLCLSSLNGQAHDRVSLVASALDTHLGDKQWLEDQSLAKWEEMRLSGAGVRRLTPTECERLQGLPDGWTLPGPDSRRYAGLGDAVTANVAEWIGRRLAMLQDTALEVCL